MSSFNEELLSWSSWTMKVKWKTFKNKSKTGRFGWRLLSWSSDSVKPSPDSEVQRSFSVLQVQRFTRFSSISSSCETPAGSSEDSALRGTPEAHRLLLPGGGAFSPAPGFYSCDRRGSGVSPLSLENISSSQTNIDCFQNRRKHQQEPKVTGGSCLSIKPTKNIS